MGILSLLRTSTFWLVLSAVLCGAAVVIHGSASYDRGYAAARAEGDAALLNLQLQHTNERAQALQDALVQYKQQIARANLAEEQLLQVQQQLTDTRHQLQERIAHVSTAYRAAPGAAPTAIPRCVFTRGWVRDFNTALGAGLPATGARTASPGTQTATWPAAGSDAELLESGVTPADILAFAQDYGAWSLRNLAQLNALLEQGE